MTLFEAINSATDTLSRSGIPTARLDAELLLRHALGRDRAWLFAHYSDDLATEDQLLFERLIGRRRTREPIQYIVGRQEFWGLDFIVSSGVLIPRPETELVVETGLKKAGSMLTPLILDLCTGSGCIAVSMAAELRDARIFATDVSEKALTIAQENARRLGVSDRIRFFEGDLFGPIEELDIRGQVDMIVSNPPYVPSSELEFLQPEVRDFEPRTALVAGPEGTEIHARIINEALKYLRHGGWLIMEMGIGQSEPLREMVEQTSVFSSVGILQDLAGIDRVITGRIK